MVEITQEEYDNTNEALEVAFKLSLETIRACGLLRQVSNDIEQDTMDVIEELQTLGVERDKAFSLMKRFVQHAIDIDTIIGDAE